MFVNLGLEIFVEMDLDQAAKYVSRRIEGLENAVKTLKNTEYQIKANIRIMLEVSRTIILRHGAICEWLHRSNEFTQKFM